MSVTRKHAMRELERSSDNINWSLHHLKTFLNMGYESRDIFKKSIDIIAETLILAQDGINKLKDKI